MEQGKATQQDLDLRCEELIKEEFGETCNFDVVDAVQKLEKLGIVAQDTIGRYYCVGLKRANEIIGTTTEELVLKQQILGLSTYAHPNGLRPPSRRFRPNGFISLDNKKQSINLEKNFPPKRPAMQRE
ncbi:hypothetical protein U1Q18_012637 [Sarracenia purpurea var. burkii]